jgi:16S rRNA (cytidine1402-2'-O)-methyltransferase
VEGGVTETTRPRGTLFVVSTPIGNMGDFSFRAVEVLKSVALVLAEDTRHTRHLLDRYDISTPATPYHEHNEAKTTPRFVARLLEGESLALVSDAGTPLVSDPGARLVRAAIDAQVDVVPIPGPSAALAALVASGLEADRFLFLGFLPRTGRGRREAFDEIVDSAHTVVVYESPNRLAATLAELERLGGGLRQAVVAREMTKQFENIQRGTVADLLAYYRERPVRGEVVLVIGGAVARVASEEEVAARVRVLRAAGLSVRDASAQVAAEMGVSKRVAYRLARSDGGETGE